MLMLLVALLQSTDTPYPVGDLLRPFARQDEPTKRPSLEPFTDSWEPRGLSLSAGVRLRWFNGSTRVREFDSVPARLSLNGDLGFGMGEGVTVAAAFDVDRSRWEFEGDFFKVSGRGMRSEDFHYDEGHFLADLPYTATGTFLFLRVTDTFKFTFVDSGAARLGLVLGLEYPRIDLGISQPGSARGGSTENYNQFLPYPIVGFAGAFNLGGGVELSARAYAGGAPPMPTIFSEGGRLQMQVTTFAVELALRWQVTDSLAISMGAGYRSWSGSLHSNEDGNDLRFASPEATLAIDLRW